MKILETERLVLRTVEEEDGEFYLGLLNDPSFIDNIGDRGVRTLEASRAAIASGPVNMQATLGHSIWMVERKDDGAPLGLCGLIKRDTLDDVDIGYAFMPAYCGQGYAYEAASAVVAHARHVIGLRRLVAITAPENHASNRLLRKIGLQFQQLTHLSVTDPGINLYAIDFAPAAGA